MEEFYPEWMHELNFFKKEAKREGLTLEAFFEKYKLEDPRKSKDIDKRKKRL